MKKISSLPLAVLSTLCLMVGAARAAEKLDGLAQAATPSIFTASVMDGPGANTNFTDGPGANTNFVDGPGANTNFVETQAIN